MEEEACAAAAVVLFLILILFLIVAGSACLMNRRADDTVPPPASAAMSRSTHAPACRSPAAGRSTIGSWPGKRVHAEFLDIMQELNEQAYALADHFLSRAK